MKKTFTDIIETTTGLNTIDMIFQLGSDLYAIRFTKTEYICDMWLGQQVSDILNVVVPHILADDVVYKIDDSGHMMAYVKDFEEYFYIYMESYIETNDIDIDTWLSDLDDYYYFGEVA